MHVKVALGSNTLSVSETKSYLFELNCRMTRHIIFPHLDESSLEQRRLLLSTDNQATPSTHSGLAQKPDGKNGHTI